MKLQQPPSSVAGQVLSPPVVTLEDEDMGTVRVSVGRRGTVLVCVDKGIFVCGELSPVPGTLHTVVRSGG